MTDEEMQQLRDDIVESVQYFFEGYDWDSAFTRYMEAQ